VNQPTFRTSWISQAEAERERRAALSEYRAQLRYREQMARALVCIFAALCLLLGAFPIAKWSPLISGVMAGAAFAFACWAMRIAYRGMKESR
jgi:hypothetical protein